MQPMVNIALRAARLAGKIICRAVDRVDQLLVEEKGRNDLVSDVDRNAEAIIIETIHKAYPDHSILAEESGIREADGEFRWIIDPLDGTTNFLHGIPHHCTSIAITQGNAVLHGVTVDHLRNEEFTASRGEGAYLNGRRIRVTATSSLSTSMMASGIPWHALQKHGPAHEAM